jgi:transcriptional regulator with XRE-family HTH domain
MKAARALREARRRAGLSQRELAEKSGVPQSTIGRIEAGAVDPRARTLDRLLRACGLDLELAPRLGQGVDRTQIRACLTLSPAARIARAGEEVRVFELLGAARRAGKSA